MQIMPKWAKLGAKTKKNVPLASAKRSIAEATDASHMFRSDLRMWILVRKRRESTSGRLKAQT